MKNKIWFAVFAFIMVISVVSANGLTVIGDSSFTVEKLVDEDKSITFNLRNEEPLDFLNVSFEDNLYVKMDSISNLSSGSDVNVTALVIGNNDFTGEIRIKGFYEAQLGKNDTTHQVQVDLGTIPSNSIDICDFIAIQGDQVIWTNLYSMPIDLRNVDTGQIEITILPSETGMRNLDIPESFRYVFELNMWQFTDICTITTVSDVGLINNPALDAIINLDLDVNFPPTTLEITFLTVDYSLEFFQEQDDIFKIKNIGDETARNIYLEGEWFKDFTKNDFTLAPGDSTNIGYIVAPSEIFRTNQTDITYVKNLTITGNFETIIKAVSIYIKPANIGEDGNETGSSLIDNMIKMIKKYCEEHPDDVTICPQAKIIFKDINKTGELDSAALDGLIRAFYNYIDKQDIESNIEKELIAGVANSSEQNLQKTESLEGRMSLLEELIGDINASAVLLTMTYGTIAVIVILLVLIWLKRRRNKRKDLQYY